MGISIKKRDNTISIIKGLGIILMVIGHSGCPEWLHDYIYMFHVPLFFITAGYFYKGCDDVSKLTTFITKRFKGLYLPFIKWSLAFLLLHNVLYSLNIYSTDIGYKQLLDTGKSIIFRMTGNEQMLGAFWFLKTLLLASCSIATVDFITSRIINRKDGIKRLTYLAIFIILTIISRIYSISLPVIDDLSRVCLGASFFISGTLIRQYNISLKIYQTVAIFIAVLILSIIQPCNMFTSSPTNSIIFFVCATTMFIALYSSIKHLNARLLTLVYIGEHTMIILALHFLCFKLVSLLKIYYYNYSIEELTQFPVISENNSFMWILYSIVGILIPLAIEHIYTIIKKKIYEHIGYRSKRTVG